MFSLFRSVSEPPVDFHALVQEGAKLIDLRTASEYASGHLPGAVNIPLRELPGRLSEIGPLDLDLVVHCQSGLRSRNAVNYLRRAGYTSVYDLGGIGNW